ncbi:lactonase family protein [Oceanospirillum sanctuarii]|uniref:lactonase family protein n=1 Tax=Oceanospirillum sanctuarii TaxID=1434821 RepID=UPI000A3BC5F1|nr:lactonase family protein [Oceanospirillum sanctuarii]
MFAYIGCRTTKERNARGEGISVVSIDGQTGALQLVELMGGLTNPSFLTLNCNRTRLYTVHGDGSEVSAFKIDSSSGRLSHLNTESTQGNNPVHLALSPDEDSLVVSNHITSSLAVLPIDDEGKIGPLRQLVKLEGEPGPHRKEQPFPKPHFNPFDPSGQFVVVPDKGLNKVFSFPFKEGRLVAEEMTEAVTRETAGPRNIVFHPLKPYAYVINELDSTVTSYSFDGNTGKMSAFQVISCLADTFTQDSRASSIQIDKTGKALYASNRGEDSIAVMSISPETGRLTLIQTMESQGKTPRFFTLDPSGRWMYALNEDSDTIVGFSVDPSDGRLSNTAIEFETGSPVCMIFAD